MVKHLYFLFIVLLLSCNSTPKEIPIKTATKPTTKINIQEFPEILHYQMDPKNGKLSFFSQDENNKYFQNHGALKDWLATKNQKLVFAMNGGMYLKDLSAQGLYIENGTKKKNIDSKKEGYGNFYLKPNGIFAITNNNQPKIFITEKYNEEAPLKYATQSGPMLVIDGKVHQKFNQDSKNVHIRNGVGILPNGNLLFAMSKKKVNFYRMAEFFLANKCEQALYLDGFVSRTYLPGKDWTQEKGKFGIIIAETE